MTPDIWEELDVKEHTDQSVVVETVEYAAPAIERREDVKGLLHHTKGSYGQPGLNW